MRTLTTATLVLVGLFAACADDGGSTDPRAADDSLEERRGLLDQSTGTAIRPPQVCPAIALARDGKCEPRDQNVPCPLVDPDCGPDAPVACAQIWKPADGHCDLRDPCARLQDEDCQGGGMPGCDPGGVVCPAIRYETNGKCEASPACVQNDPDDCAIVCTAIRYPDDGKCEAPKGCEANDPVDCAQVACIEIRYPDNGKCEAASGCEYTDPVDCRPVACLVYVPRDGVCPPGGDPCDPDCRR